MEFPYLRMKEKNWCLFPACHLLWWWHSLFLSSLRDELSVSQVYFVKTSFERSGRCYNDHLPTTRILTSKFIFSFSVKYFIKRHPIFLQHLHGWRTSQTQTLDTNSRMENWNFELEIVERAPFSPKVFKCTCQNSVLLWIHGIFRCIL